MSKSTGEEKDIETSARDSSPDHAVGEVKDIRSAKTQDAALEFLRSGGEAKPMSASDEKALLRKIDWRIMPLMFGCYTLRMCRLGTKQAACL
jgi:hypothetical protein